MLGSEVKEFNSNMARLNSSIWFDEDLPFHVSNLAGHQGIPFGSRRGNTPWNGTAGSCQIASAQKGHISFTICFKVLRMDACKFLITWCLRPWVCIDLMLLTEFRGQSNGRIWLMQSSMGSYLTSPSITGYCSHTTHLHPNVMIARGLRIFPIPARYSI